MRIESLEIKKLHSLYDYDVKFNSDLTFLYGTNGCGKTTILNIIEAIVSGHIYDLYLWSFEKIRLKYVEDDKTRDNGFFIQIFYNNENLCVTFKGNNKTIKKDDFLRCCEDSDSYEELFHTMLSKYDFLSSIKEEFNFVYLPLNRNTTSFMRSSLYKKFIRSNRYRFMYYDSDEYGLSREEEIGKAARLVQKRYVEASAQVRAINDEFRNHVLQSLLSANNKLSDHNFITFIVESTIDNNLEELKGQYRKLLASLELLNDKEESTLDLFFSEYKKKVETLLNRKNKSQFPFSLIYDYHEIEKIKTVIPFAQEAEEKKARALSRINNFIAVMNSFLCLDNEEKRLSIDETGRICFLNNANNTDIGIGNLSSGEKQLLVFFSNLAFSVDDTKPSIFVVDEPELSLHLSWQKIFVEKAMKINGNMQLIFATHAPEIIGSYNDKMFRLEKKIREDV